MADLGERVYRRRRESFQTKVIWIWCSFPDPRILGLPPLLDSRYSSLGMAYPRYLGLMPLLDPSSWGVAVLDFGVTLLLFFSSNSNNICFTFINNYINNINNNTKNNAKNNNNNNYYF